MFTPPNVRTATVVDTTGGVVVVDTQVYSNTGGQACTSGFFGQISDMAQFGDAIKGKEEARKEIERQDGPDSASGKTRRATVRPAWFTGAAVVVALIVVAALVVLGVLATRLFATPVYTVPDLVEIQRRAYEDFLMKEVPQGGRPEAGLESLLRTRVVVRGSGRTDTGVHALGQVANFHVDTRLSDDRLRHALNFHLPEAVVIRRLETCRDDFHARFDARAKRYAYRVDTPIEGKSQRNTTTLENVSSAADADTLKNVSSNSACVPIRRSRLSAAVKRSSARAETNRKHLNFWVSVFAPCGIDSANWKLTANCAKNLTFLFNP